MVGGHRPPLTKLKAVGLTPPRLPLMRRNGQAPKAKLEDQTRPRHQGVFHRFAKVASRAAGHGFAFGLAIGAVLAWALAGPIFQFNDTWQLTINTATTIITFLMVFLIQNSQNRESEAVQLKLMSSFVPPKPPTTPSSTSRSYRRKSWTKSRRDTRAWRNERWRRCGPANPIWAAPKSARNDSEQACPYRGVLLGSVWS